MVLLLRYYHHHHHRCCCCCYYYYALSILLLYHPLATRYPLRCASVVRGCALCGAIRARSEERRQAVAMRDAQQEQQ
jgi:hypothetical protein